MHLHLKALLIIGLVTILTACQSTPPRQSNIPTSLQPQWINTPPADTSRFLYGMGVAMTKKEAIQEALVDLSSKLGIYVESDFQATIKVTEKFNTLVEKNSEKNIHTQVKGLTLNQYQIESTYTASPIEFHVLLKTDKQSLYLTYKNELEQTLKNYQAEQVYFKKLGAYARYQQSCQQHATLQSFKRQLAATKTLNPAFELSPFQDYIHRLNTQFQQTKKHFSFKISSRDNNSRAFATPLSTELAKANLWKKSANSLKIKLSSSARFNKANGFYIGRYRLNLKLYEGSKLISGRVFNLKGTSLQNKRATRTQAIKNFTKIIHREGLWNTLNLPNIDCG